MPWNPKADSHWILSRKVHASVTRWYTRRDDCFSERHCGEPATARPQPHTDREQRRPEVIALRCHPRGVRPRERDERGACGAPHGRPRAKGTAEARGGAAPPVGAAKPDRYTRLMPLRCEVEVSRANCVRYGCEGGARPPHRPWVARAVEADRAASTVPRPNSSSRARRPLSRARARFPARTSPVPRRRIPVPRAGRADLVAGGPARRVGSLGPRSE